MAASFCRLRRRTVILAAAALAAAGGTAWAAPVDFTTFLPAQGVMANTFAVAAWSSPTLYNGHTLTAGQIAIEPTNADTTLFYGPAELTVTNKIITGDIYFGGDDDHLGLAFGVKPSPNAVNGNPLLDVDGDYLLLQWKGVTQNFDFVDVVTDPPGQFHNATPGAIAPAGLSLSRVRGIPTADEFWQRADLVMNYNPPIDPVPPDPGGLTELGRGVVSGGTGYGAKHSFEIHYTPTNIRVFVDGALEFDVNAPAESPFPDGTLALYEQAQSPSGAFAFFDIRNPGDPAPAPPQSLFPVFALASAKVSSAEATANAASTWNIDATSPGVGAIATVSAANVADVDFSVGGVNMQPTNGVLVPTIRQNGLRTNGDPNDARHGLVEAPANSGFNVGRTGLATFTFNVGGGEWNVNAAIGFFPYSRFRGGYYTYLGTPAVGTLQYSSQLGTFTITELAVPLPTIVKYGENLNGTPAGGTNSANYVGIQPQAGFYVAPQQVLNNLKIDGENSLTDGLLFVTSASNEGNFANSVPLADGSWNIAVRDSDTTHFGGPDTFERDHFNFLYIEQTDIQNSVAARVTSFDAAGAPTTAQSWGEYTLRRAGRGLYTLSITGGPTFTVEMLGNHIVGDLSSVDVDTNADGTVDVRRFTDTQDVIALPFDGQFSFAFIPLDEMSKADGILLLAAQDPITLSDGTVAPLPRWMTYEEGGLVQWTGGGGADTSWDSASNWDGAIPNGAEARAYLLGKDTNAGSVDIGPARTLGVLRLENANSYTLQGGSLQMGDEANHGAIDIVEGSHAITAPITFPGGLTINGAPGAGTLTVPHLRGTRLNLNNASVLIAGDGGDAGTSLVTALFITPGSRLDLNNNALAIDHAPPTPPATSAFPEALLRLALRAGYNEGNWDGQGIASLAAKNDAQKITAVGSAPSTAVIDFAGGTTATWNGVTVDDSSALLMHTYYGDSNLSGIVDAADYILADRGFLSRQDAVTTNDLFGWLNGDYNYDGLVNISDFSLMDRAFSMQGAALGGGPGAIASAVPEPAALLPLVMGSLTALTRRRRSN